jgi:hypothetical protein
MLSTDASHQAGSLGRGPIANPNPTLPRAYCHNIRASADYTSRLSRPHRQSSTAKVSCRRVIAARLRPVGKSRVLVGPDRSALTGASKNPQNRRRQVDRAARACSVSQACRMESLAGRLRCELHGLSNHAMRRASEFDLKLAHGPNNIIWSAFPHSAVSRALVGVGLPFPRAPAGFFRIEVTDLNGLFRLLQAPSVSRWDRGRYFVMRGSL